jgi:type IX secretion system PorP/SprF family membrane protein
MKKIRRYIILLIASGSGIAGAFAQQGPQYTQFMFNNLAINPAYAGADEHPSITLVAREQWSNIENAPSTQSLAAHTLLKKRVGLGLTIVRDQIGIHKNTNAVASYAYHLRAGKKAFVSMGLQAGINSFKSDYPSLQQQGNDPLLAKYVKATKFNIGTGIYFRSPKLDAGVSFPGLLPRNQHVNDTVVVNFRTADALGYFRYRLPISQSFTLQPSLLIKYFPGLPLSFDTNWMIVYKEVLSTGVSYRKNESLDLVIRLQLTVRLEAGYSYDYPVGDGSLLNSASHELMMHYVFRKNTKNIVSPR